MTPVERLADARSSVVGPYVPAREEWFTDWQGPARDREWNVNVVILESFGPTCLVYGTDPTGQGAEWELRVSRIRLDLRRPEVQDQLVRHGAPEWARRLPAALWVWAVSGKVMEDVLKPWETWYGRAEIRIGTRKTRRCTLSPTASGCWEWSYDVVAPEHRQIVCATVETGPEGMALANLAALSRGCILEEADGWLVPLPDGGVGFWPREAK